MELNQLRYFLEVARSQHITKTAAALHIAQPALTKSIHNLEKELGVPLFSRTGRNIALTRYGQYLLERLTPIFGSLDSLTDDLHTMASLEDRTIRLSLMAGSGIVTNAIIEFKKLYPDATFHVLKNPDKEQFDLEITTDLCAKEKIEDSPNKFVISERIFLAVPDIEKYRRPCIALSEVQNEGFISLFASKELRNICDTFCRQAGFEPKVAFESDSLYAVQNMISANIGIGFWPEHTWGRLNGDNVRLLEISRPECRRDIIITYHPGKEDPTYCENFFAFLKSCFEREWSK